MDFIENPEVLHEIEVSRHKDLISQEQLIDTKIYPDRLSFIDTLPKGISYLEVGVLGGDFAIDVIKKISASKAVLVDPYFTEDSFERQYKVKRWSDKKFHYKFVKNRFKNMLNVELYAGTYKFFCSNRPDTFDFIYVDYHQNKEEASYNIFQSIQRLNPGGILGFNDYCRYGSKEADGTISESGIIGPINYFLRNNKDWYVYAFAFNEDMMSDIYLKKYSD